MMELDTLRSFIAFTEHLNFTRAAKELHISQPALHIKIRKLTNSLGVTLYERHGKNLSLTNKGQEVLRFARQITQTTREFEQTIAGKQVQQNVKLAAGEGIFLYLLGPVIQEYRRKVKSGLKLITAQSHEVISSVMSGAVHFGITAATSYPQELKATPLSKVPMVLVLPTKHPLGNRKTVNVSHLSGLDLIVPPSERPHRQLIDRHTQSANVSWNVAVEANGWELILHFVKLKLGYTVVNGSCKIPKGFVAIPFTDLPSTQYHLLHLKGVDKTGNHLRLVDTIKSHFK